MTALGDIQLTEEQEAAIQFWLLDLADRYSAPEQERDDYIRTLELSLIDCENWMEMALRAGCPFPRPASFGQWRRPKGAK